VSKIIVLQSFGRENEYRRAIVAIWSFFAHAGRPLSESTSVLLFTDKPDFFDPYLKGLQIRFVLLTGDRIKAMRGPIDFLHRMKIAMIDEAFELTGNEADLLYVDSDTFFTADPATIFSQISAEASFMHTLEYPFTYLPTLPLPAGEPFHKFFELIRDKTFHLQNEQKVKIEPSLASWNAGVIGLHKTHRRLLNAVYELTDQFYPPTQNHASEQYAFSIILQTHTQLQPCEKFIHHYWYRVDKMIMDDFLATHLNTEWSMQTKDKKEESLKQWVHMLPRYFNTHVLKLQDMAIQAFCENQYRKAYTYVWKTMWKKPGDLKFWKDVLYHSKRLIGWR
jgi:hypothetical protein